MKNKFEKLFMRDANGFHKWCNVHLEMLIFSLSHQQQQSQRAHNGQTKQMK